MSPHVCWETLNISVHVVSLISNNSSYLDSSKLTDEIFILFHSLRGREFSSAENFDLKDLAVKFSKEIRGF